MKQQYRELTRLLYRAIRHCDSMDSPEAIKKIDEARLKAMDINEMEAESDEIIAAHPANELCQ